MKTILSALVALSFLAGVVAPANAAEPFSIKQLDAEGRGGHDRGLWAYQTPRLLDEAPTSGRMLLPGS